MNLVQRPRRLRSTAGMRNLVRETTIRASQLVLPLFVQDGKGINTTVSGLPMVRVLSIDQIAPYLEPMVGKGLGSVLLFGKVSAGEKTPLGDHACDPRGVVPRAIRHVRTIFPDLVVMSDVALDPYTTHGHDGIVEDGCIVNDASVDVLARMSLVHAEAGVHVVAPSDMMDGRVGAIRAVLDEHGHSETSIMAYTAKYASCLYGPFRTILESAPTFGDKRTYQMDPANLREAEREARLDLAEGADIVMVKPAMWYLDVIQRLAAISDRPVAAYHVSGEAQMIVDAAARGALDLTAGVNEATTAIVRAGADIVVTYFVETLLDQGSAR